MEKIKKVDSVIIAMVRGGGERGDFFGGLLSRILPTVKVIKEERQRELISGKTKIILDKNGGGYN